MTRDGQDIKRLHVVQTSSFGRAFKESLPEKKIAGKETEGNGVGGQRKEKRSEKSKVYLLLM